MRTTPCLALALLLAGCIQQQPPATPPRCAEPRPQVCTMEYAPVCGELIAGGERQYSSACNACADDTVAGYRSGLCPE
jgi:hypothetical protein